MKPQHFKLERQKQRFVELELLRDIGIMSPVWRVFREFGQAVDSKNEKCTNSVHRISSSLSSLSFRFFGLRSLPGLSIQVNSLFFLPVLRKPFFLFPQTPTHPGVRSCRAYFFYADILSRMENGSRLLLRPLYTQKKFSAVTLCHVLPMMWFRNIRSRQEIDSRSKTQRVPPT